ncbi:TetR family transcriptional regulator [soil metagenome]
MARPPETRQEGKDRTRRKLLRAALKLLEKRSFDRLSLRQVTKEVGIVPGAFYRHFHDMDELGLALVEESFGSLRGMIRSARADVPTWDDAIVRSVETLVTHVHAHRTHFRFLVRERAGGTPALRAAIEGELRAFTDELAVDMRGFPYLGDWDEEDITMLASLVVATVMDTAAALTDLPRDRPEVETAIIRTTERQLRLIFLGVPHWDPRPSSRHAGSG